MHMLLPDGKFAIGVDRQLQEFQEQEQQQSGRVVVWADPLRPEHPERIRLNSIFRLFALANIPITFIIEITAAVLFPIFAPARLHLLHPPTHSPPLPFFPSILCQFRFSSMHWQIGTINTIN